MILDGIRVRSIFVKTQGIGFPNLINCLWGAFAPAGESNRSTTGLAA